MTDERKKYHLQALDDLGRKLGDFSGFSGQPWKNIVSFFENGRCAGAGVILSSEGFVVTNASIGQMMYRCASWNQPQKQANWHAPGVELYDGKDEIVPLDPSFYIEKQGIALLRLTENEEIEMMRTIEMARSYPAQDVVDQKRLQGLALTPPMNAIEGQRLAVAVDAGYWDIPFQVYTPLDRFEVPIIDGPTFLMGKNTVHHSTLKREVGSEKIQRDLVYSKGERVVLVTQGGIQEPRFGVYTGLALTHQSIGAGVFTHTDDLVGIVNEVFNANTAITIGERQEPRAVPLTQVRSVSKEMISSLRTEFEQS